MLQYGCSKRATEERASYPILRMNNLQSGGWVLDDLKYIDLSPDEVATWRLQKGDIIFNRTNSKELVGKCEVFDQVGVWVFASYLMRLRVNERRAIPEFVSAFLNTRAGRAQIDRESRQIIGMSNINANEIRSVLVPLPPKATQQRLVHRLHTARAGRDQKLKQADELLASLDEFVLGELELKLPPPDNSMIHAVRYSDLRGGRCDASYHAPRFKRAAQILAMSNLRKEPLGKLSPLIAGGATPTRGDQELYATSGIHFLRIMNVAPFEIRLDDVKYIAPSVHENALVRSQLKPNDVLMTITGRVGTSAVVPREVLPANINQHIVRIRLVSKAVHPEFLVAYLNSSLGLLVTNRGVTGGTRIAIDYGTISQLQIPVPDIAVQSKIVAEVGRRRDQARRLRAEAEALWDEAKREFENALLSPV